MSLEQRVANLPPEKRFQLAITFAKLTLAIWDNYARKNKLSYIDSVVGMYHSVDKNILQNTILAVEKKQATNAQIIAKLQEDFIDPIVALQDMDWELPNEVLCTFYAVYNLLEAFLGKDKTIFGESTIYVSINQAIDALLSSKTMVLEAVEQQIQAVENELN